MHYKFAYAWLLLQAKHINKKYVTFIYHISFIDEDTDSMPLPKFYFYTFFHRN